MNDDESLLSEEMRAAFAAVELRAGFAERVTRAWLDEQASAAASRWRPPLPLVVGTMTLAAAGAMFLLLRPAEPPSATVRSPAVTAPAAAPRRPSPPDTPELKEAKAQYQIGEAFMGKERYAEAIGAYTKAIEGAPESDVAVDAMFKTGVAFAALHYCSDAKEYFEQLILRHPRSARVRDAQRCLLELARVQNDKSVCAN